MTQQINELRAQAAEVILLADGLLDEPDCLAELEHCYSVFRFRYEWGTVYELTFSNLSDAHDRQSCMALMPAAHVFLESIDTNTLGGGNGIVREITQRFVTSHY